MKLRLKEYISSPLGIWYRIRLELSSLANILRPTPKLEHNHSKNFREAALEEYHRKHDGQRSKSVVYTCITNGYDDIYEIATPGFINVAWDYVCFTDNEDHIRKGYIGVWQMRPLAYSQSDATRNNRWHKMHPVELSPDYDESLYIDANIDILTDWIFKEIRQRDNECILPCHPIRDCIFEEYKFVMAQFLDDPKRLITELKLIKKSGMPQNYGMAENNILYRKHSSVAVRSIMKEWWDMVVKYSKRDQLCLMWLLWKRGINVKDYLIPNPRFDTNNCCVFAHASTSKKGAIGKV